MAFKSETPALGENERNGELDCGCGLLVLSADQWKKQKTISKILNSWLKTQIKN